MSRKSQSDYLQSTVDLLVEHFGIGRVRSALAKVSNEPVATTERHGRERLGKQEHPVVPSIPTLLEALRDRDPVKSDLLCDFYSRLKERLVLPEAQDIRHFAQLVGLKEIAGKARKDMVPKLMRALIDRPSDRLRQDIEAAANVSEQQRQQGFSILTDKILSGAG